MRLWKMLGVAGLAGVAATGVVIVRNERSRAQLTPAQVRQRLHARAGQVERDGQDPGSGAVGAPGADPDSAESSARA